ncbi:hypothetical protein KMP13_04330 [Epibacterium ulvae]|uniref:hypothetical protein n=1 Tax=Epibacterium ulvae TaxID=1156985 RepID=UPI001BFCB369|nr:hypothetical protein [Epibacterium ulvae]MBT8153128.1 hypothetical protein [Epibacterium ulvae]
MNQFNVTEDMLKSENPTAEGLSIPTSSGVQRLDCDDANSLKGVGIQITFFSLAVAVISFIVSFFVLGWGIGTSLVLYVFIGWVTFIYVLICVLLVRRIRDWRRNAS